MVKNLGLLAVALLAGTGMAACGPLDGSGVAGAECAAISESDGEDIARRALWAFIEEVKAGGYEGVIGDGGKEISADRVRAIRPQDVTYAGMSTGEIENGEIYEFRITGIDDIQFGVQVFENCNTEVRWRNG